jgi:methylglutaconyl-CoA hydratase
MAAVELERRGAAAWLWLNRPEVRNALNDEVSNLLLKSLQNLEKDNSCRILVLAGRGQAFSAGGDLGRMEHAAKMPKGRNVREARRFADLLYRMHRYPKPIVARVHGPAFAGGMGLAAACDLVIACEEAEFCLPEVRIGLVPAMISPYIARALGEPQTRRYMLTGERLVAREAQRLGFVHECVPMAELDAAVEKITGHLAKAGPNALAQAKKLLARIAAAPIGPRLAGETAALLAEVRAGAEAREGIRSFLEKRKPGWQL